MLKVTLYSLVILPYLIQRITMMTFSFSKTLSLAIFSLFAFSIVSCRSTSKTLVNVKCVYTFKNVASEEDQNKLENAIVSVIGSDFKKSGTDANPTYSFVAKNASQIDEIHSNIKELKSGKDKDNIQSKIFNNTADQGSAFYMEKPEYHVTYGSIGLEAKVEVIVNFKITPGSKLWYKPQDQMEIDITDKVDKKGNVKFATKIIKNQEFILGRTSYKGAERFIQVNIFTGEVLEINQNQYR